MALDLSNKPYDVGQIFKSVWDPTSNTIQVSGTVDVDPDGLATAALQQSILDELEAQTVVLEEIEVNTASSGGGSVVEFDQYDYAAVPVTTLAYTEIIAATTAEATSVNIFDSSGQSLYIAFGEAGLEVDQMIIVPGGNGTVSLAIPAATRVSVKAISDDADAGELILNLFG